MRSFLKKLHNKIIKYKRYGILPQSILYYLNDNSSCVFQKNRTINKVYGNSLIENDCVSTIKEIFLLAKENDCKIIFPSTHVVYEGLDEIKLADRSSLKFTLPLTLPPSP